MGPWAARDGAKDWLKHVDVAPAARKGKLVTKSHAESLITEVKEPFLVL